MDLKLKHITWVGNIYQKFEAVCQEVDDIVGQDAVKYLENRVHHVGDSVKKFYSDVVQEILPLSPLVNSAKQGDHSVALKNNIGSSLNSIAGVIDNNEKGAEENPVNNFIRSLQDSNAIDTANDQQVHASIKHDLVNKFGNETSSNSLGVGNSCVTQEEIVEDSRETSDAIKENFHVSIEQKAGVIDNNEKEAEENPVHNFIKSLQDSNTIDTDTDLQVHESIKHDLVNQVSDETSSNSLEVEDSYVAQEDIDDDSREISNALKENFLVSIEQNDVESTSQLLNMISFKEKKPLEFLILGESLSGSSDCRSGVLDETKNNTDVRVEQTSCSTVEENAMKSSYSQVKYFTSLSEKELFAPFLYSEPSDSVDEDMCGIPTEVSPSTSCVTMKSQSSSKAGTFNDNITDRDQFLSDGSESSDTQVAYSTVSCERPMTKMEPLCFKSSLISDSFCAKSPGSYSFEIESCKNNSADVSGCSSDSSMVSVSCEPTGQIMASQDGLVSSGCRPSMESNEGETFGVDEVMALNNSSGTRHGQICSAQDRAIISLSDLDESLVNSVESSMEDIQLSDNAKLEESCVFVDDSELYAVSCRAQRLRSYKKRIRDAFASKKRLVKEYEQLAIWYGDTDMEPSQGTSQVLLPFNSKRFLDSKNLQVQHECETGWELL